MKFSNIIEEQLAQLPDLPGVYMMRDDEGEIIYVGKAKNLKNRVRSYFRGFVSHDLKTQTLIVSIRDFDYIIASNEKEALVLEANLIKRYQPRFNILLKDDKFYPYIVVTDEDFPRILVTRNIAAFPGAFAFGPYTVKDAVDKLVQYLQTTYRLRECSKKIDGRSPRPCLNYFIGRCSAPCSGYIGRDEYRTSIDSAVDILKNRPAAVVRGLEREMLENAEKLNFERAAELRDIVAAFNGLSIKQRVLQTGGKNQDYVAGAVDGDKACAMVFQYRDGSLIGRETFSFKGTKGLSERELLESFIKQYYTGPENIPPEIYIGEDIEGTAAFEQWFGEIAGFKVVIGIPRIGDKKKLVDLVRQNSVEYLARFQNRIDREQEDAEKIEAELRELLGIGENLRIRRIEAFDISNTSGVHSVGSMVAFENAKKKKTDYRRFRIKTVDGPDDYSSMQEVVYRRYSKQNQGLPTPDLILIDGGKGHVNAAQKVLDALGLHIPVAGMVKDDFHKTEDLIFNGEALGLKEKRRAFRLVYSIQEEVHRFAIEYHKSLRSKEMLRSELDAITGIGEKRKIALLKHFKAVDAIALASVEELMKCSGITRAVAENIREYFDVKRGL